MRINQASLDPQNQFGVADDDNGLEWFLTATRRQNFLIPPRRHRAFPLAEFTSPGAPAAGRARIPAGLGPVTLPRQRPAGPGPAVPPP